MGNQIYSNKQLRSVFWGGLLLRYAFLILVIILGENNVLRPFIMSDDQVYEELAQQFLANAGRIFDFDTAYITGIDGYLQVFWPYVMCFSAKLFGTAYAGRILNCLFSALCILLVYRITFIISKREDTSLLAAKLMAFFPYMVIFAAFPLKDVFLSMAVLYVLMIILKWYENLGITVWEVIFTILLAVCIYLTRGAVVEFLGLALTVFMVAHYIRNKKQVMAVLVVLVGAILFVILKDDVLGAFETKIDDYNSESYISDGMLRYIQINKLTDIWRLPFTYFFAIIQPMTMSLFNFNWTDWSPFLRLLNIAAYPIAFGNLAYVVMKKHNIIFWLATFVMFAAVLSLSLGIYRHYMFLYPTLLINYSLVKELKNKTAKSFIRIGSIALFALVIVLSL